MNGFSLPHFTGGLVVTMALTVVLAGACYALASAADTPVQFWRSTLYPENWSPGYSDEAGRFLQDFSFAGYHYGTKEIPVGPTEPVIDVTSPPYNADNTGIEDASSAIQAALDAVGSQGGGTVYLPAGTYRLLPSEATAILSIRYSNVRLLGAGPDKTRLFVDSYNMRHKSLIDITGTGTWQFANASGQVIAADLTYPTQVVPLEGTPKFKAGDAVIISYQVTKGWLEEHDIADRWPEGSSPGQVMIARQVLAVDNVANTITIDAPTRYTLLRRDKAAVVFDTGLVLEEVGVSGFSVGMLEHPGTGWQNPDYKTVGTGAYDVNGSTIIRIHQARNSWVTNVHTYKPEVNQNYHIHSNGIRITDSRLITIAHNDIRHPQSHTGGTDGYLYYVVAGDNLFAHNVAYNGRHNFTLSRGKATGNVFTGNYSHNEKPLVSKGGLQGISSDYHMHFSASNLFENMVLDGDHLHAGWREEGSAAVHGLTTTQSVYWNIHGLRYSDRKPDNIINSEQAGWGYIIGTSGPASVVKLGDHPKTLPIDYTEGIGKGTGLQPQSLYYDQLRRRLAGKGVPIDTVGLDFRPETARLSFLSPYTNQELSGVVPVKIAATVPANLSLVNAVLKVDDEEIYRSAAIPRNLEVDTSELADGPHEFTASIHLSNSTTVSATVSVNVANWWTIVESFKQPITTGWFGFVERLNTIDRSSGWVYENDNAALYDSDETRLRAPSSKPEYLVWETPNLKSLTIRAFTTLPSAHELFNLAVSPDGQTWHTVPFLAETLPLPTSTQHQLNLRVSVPEGVPANFLRLKLGGENAENIQLGEVTMQGRVLTKD